MIDETGKQNSVTEIPSVDNIISDDEPVSADQQVDIEGALHTFRSPTISGAKSVAAEPVAAPSFPPWTLQQFFNGEIDLDAELSKRFQNVPMLTTVKFRDLGSQKDRGVATLSSPDGAAQVIFDVDKASKVVQMSFTWGSMLTLRFIMRDLSDMDRSRWLRLMRRKEGGLTFLWGPTRWEKDYVICISRRFFTNFYTFSPNGYEASIRLTPDVTKELLDWLDKYWQIDDADKPEPPKLLTW